MYIRTRPRASAAAQQTHVDSLSYRNRKDFADGFREHVVPVLRHRISIGAIDMLFAEHWDADHLTYSSVFSEVWWLAWRRGASFLSISKQNRLAEWIHHQLLAEIDRLEPAVAEVCDRSDRVWIDARRWQNAIREVVTNG